ncbi:MAG TPA: O-antigen ligase family protein [Nostocaceae cyanobacterium]|nr:O-antigen ligase family protein [Nostocaceae cyanobacterium]
MKILIPDNRNQLTNLGFVLILLSSLLRRINFPHSNMGIHYVLLSIFACSIIAVNKKYIAEVIKKQKPFFISVGIFYLWMWLCSISSPFPITSITYSIKYSVYFIILLAFLLLTYLNKNLFFYYRCILSFLQMIAALGFVEALFPKLEIFKLLKFPSFYPQIGSIMQNPNQFGVIMVIGLCITLILGKQKNISQFEQYINVITFLIALALSASRNSWAMLIIATTLLCLYQIISFRKSFFVLGLCFLCVLLLPVAKYKIGLGNSQIFSLDSFFITNPIESKIPNPVSSAVSRLKIWQAAIAEFIKRPITGIGIGVFAEHIKVFGVKGIHTHNIFLSVLAELGITGIIIFINFLKNLTNKVQFLNPIITIPITIFLASQMVDFFIEDYTFTTIELFFLTAAINAQNQLA